MRRLAIAAALAVTLLAAGCPEDDGKDAGPTPTDVPSDAGAPDTPDVPDMSERSYYTLKVDLELEPGNTIDLGVRDITGRESEYFAFGSTHIAPAVSFAMTETLYYPRTMVVTLNFGIVVPSDQHAVQTWGAHDYPFSADPPEVDITVGLRYRSTVAGSTGSITVTDYSTTEGGLMAGSFAGRIWLDTGPENKKWADVEGSFHFILPAPAGAY